MKPEKVYRFGSYISACVFANEIETNAGKKTVRNVKLQRRYKDGDSWKTSSSFTLQDLPTAIAVLKQAMAFVASMEAVTEE